MSGAHDDSALSTRHSALVTGAAGGIGASIARRLAADGWLVALVDRREADLAALAAETGGRPYAVDLLDAGALAPLVERVEAECGPLGGLVNCAGVVKTVPFLEETAEGWDSTLGVNTRAPFLLMQAAGARMIARGRGAIVNIASVAGRSGRPEQTSYGASKAALLHLTKSAALALGPRGVRVNAVCPGVVRTPMTEQIWRDRRPEDVARILANIPLGRTAAPDEVAAAVSWLLSDQSSYVNGQALNVCGGLEMD